MCPNPKLIVDLFEYHSIQYLAKFLQITGIYFIYLKWLRALHLCCHSNICFVVRGRELGCPSASIIVVLVP